MVQRLARRLQLGRPLACWAAVEWRVDRSGPALPGRETLPRRKWEAAASPGKEGFSCSLFHRVAILTVGPFHLILREDVLPKSKQWPLCVYCCTPGWRPYLLPSETGH